MLILAALSQNGILIAKYDGTDAGKTRADFNDLPFHVLREHLKVRSRLRARADKAHVPEKNVEELGQLIDLCGRRIRPKGRMCGSFFVVRRPPAILGLSLSIVANL